MKPFVLFSVWSALCCAVFGVHEDSLRSALSAVDKRQRYLNRYGDDVFSTYPYSDENLEFLNTEEKPYYKTILSELQDDISDDEFFKKTSFREREEEARKREREQLRRQLSNYENIENDDGVTYGKMVDDYADKYPKSWRYYYSNLPPKRNSNRFYQPESISNTAAAIYALSYLPRHETEDKNAVYTDSTLFSQHKRFPVSKRSGNFLQKRSSNIKELQKKTDPKVEKELINIFGSSHNKTQLQKQKQSGGNNKEVAVPPAVSKAEPIEIKKKSIDWSDYFGLDRRKKSDDQLDKEWLMERYHKAVSMTAKRSTEYPLQHFHNHDEPQNQQKPEKVNKSEPTVEETKLKEIDEKLKSIEDAIVDDALKYTGAHEGTIDSKEIQEVKDRVISRLAAAYSLEKMRRALGEYKLSIAKEKGRSKEADKNSEDVLFSEDKRISVPRKQAVDEEIEKPQNTDNNIKCKGDNCELQNFKIPSRMLDQFQWGIEECPKVQRECSYLVNAVGKYGRAFEMACNIHQLCLLCDDNSNWYAPTVRCNALYLSKANEICSGNNECLKVAQYLLENLLLLNRNDFPQDGCNLICPENER